MTDTLTLPKPKARRPRKIDAALRQRIEHAVEAMIEALNALDAPTEDLEEGDEGGDQHDDGEPDEDGEPSLGSVGVHELSSQSNWSAGGTDDREGDEHDGAEPDVDNEPSLGSFDRLTNQEHSWRQREGSSALYLDAEVDRADWEPSLGAGETRLGQSQKYWAVGGRDDREDDPAELGIADDGGLAEQQKGVL
jgi:hypothetical protein